MGVANCDEMTKALCELKEKIMEMEDEKYSDCEDILSAKLYFCKCEVYTESASEMVRMYSLYSFGLDKIDDEKSRSIIKGEWQSHSRIIVDLLVKWKDDISDSQNVNNKKLLELGRDVVKTFNDASQFIKMYKS